MNKKSVHILWFFVGIFVIAIASYALDVGDDSECSENQIIYTDNGSVWRCGNLEEINMTMNVTVTDIINITINGSSATLNGSTIYDWNDINVSPKDTWQNTTNDINYDEGDVSIANDLTVTGNITTESVKTTGNVASEFQTLQNTWAFKYDPALVGGTDIGLKFDLLDGLVTTVGSLDMHRIATNGDLYLGNPGDTKITFSPSSPQGVGEFTWMEDENYFTTPNNWTYTGMVGIGTTEPLSVFNVVGESIFEGNVSIVGQYLGVGSGSSISPGFPDRWDRGAFVVVDDADFNGDAGIFIRESIFAGLDLWYDESTNDGYIENLGDCDDCDIIFRTKTSGNPVNATIIKGSGNIGIGTITPESKLSIIGDVNISGNLTTSNLMTPSINLSGQTLYDWDDLKITYVNLTANDTFMSVNPKDGQAFTYNSTNDKYVNNYILAIHTKLIDVAGYFTDEDVEGALGQLANEVGGGSIPGTNTSSDWQDSVISQSVTSPPASPSHGDRYIVPYAELGDWYGAVGEWDYRQEIPINHLYVSADEVNKPVKIVVDNATNEIFGNALSNGYDIVFTHSNKTTKLSHELISYNDTMGYEYLEAEVNVTNLNSTSDTIIYMYYGNPVASRQENPESVWDSDYEAVFHMDSANASTLNDSTGNSYIAENKGYPDEIEGITGKAQSYDGTNDWTNTSVLTDMSGGGPFTISAWVKDVNSGSNYIIAQAHTMPSYSSDWIYGYGNNGAWMRSKIIDGGNTLADGDWHQMDLVFDGTTMMLYIDGVKQPVTQTPTGYGGVNSIKFFTRGDANNRYQGKLDEVKISTTNRSAEWLNTSYNNIKYMSDFISFGPQTVSAGAETEWTGYTNNITTFNTLLGNWTFESPEVGWATIVVDEEKSYWWDGDAWSALKSSVPHDGLSRLYGCDANGICWHFDSPAKMLAATRDATNSLSGLVPSGKLSYWDNKWSVGTTITENVEIETTEPEILLEDTDDSSAYSISYDKTKKNLNISKGNNSGEDFISEPGLANIDLDGTLRAKTSIITGSTYSGELISGQANVVQYVLGSGASSIGRFFCYDGSSYYKCIFGDYNGGNGGIVLDAGGNVGITKATPTVSLDVGGSANFDGNITAHAIDVDNNVTATTINIDGEVCIDDNCVSDWADINGSSNTIWQNSSSNIDYSTGNVTIGKKLTVTENVTAHTFKSSSDVALEFENLQSMWAFKYNPSLIADTGLYFDAIGGEYQFKYGGATPFKVNILGEITTLNDINLGNTLDSSMFWSPSGTNTGEIEWKEDEDYFDFHDDIFLSYSEALILGNADRNISSNGLDIILNDDSKIIGNLNVTTKTTSQQLDVKGPTVTNSLIVNNTVLYVADPFGLPTVGIGKTNPTYSLEVVGDVNVSDQLYLGNDSFANGAYRTYNPVGLQFENLQSTWAFKYNSALAGGTDIGLLFDTADGLVTKYLNNQIHRIDLAGNLYTGYSQDTTHTFSPSGSNVGTLTWFEDENYFRFNDDVIFQEEVNFSKEVHINNNLTTSNGGKLWSNASCTFLSSPDNSNILEVCNT